jgi:hypothetical protein
MRKRIGVLAQYLDSRHDIREFIKALTKDNEVVVYLRSNDGHLARLLSDKVEIRTIKAQVRRSVWNNALIFFYKLFGVLPVSEHNYFITEFFKLNNAHLTPWNRFKESCILHASKLTPKFISYDGYLKSLRYKKDTVLDDIDEFLCFTQIYEDLFLAHVLETGKKVKVYVYSWDHPCKMKTFSKRVAEYLVWNEGLKEDLITLQFIDPLKIRVFGATQLTYNYDFLHSEKAQQTYYSFPYIYFACATGYPKLVNQEVALIEKTAAYLAAQHPEFTLVVRTYPFFGAEELYAPLKKYSNILIDDYKSKFDPTKDPLGVITDKLVKMNGAKGLIHLGTTFGLEASYFKAPVILADVAQDYKQLDEFVHQYQNDKYLNLSFKNIPKTWSDYEQAIHAMINNKQEMNLYNPVVAGTTTLHAMDTLAQQF